MKVGARLQAIRSQLPLRTQMRFTVQQAPLSTLADVHLQTFVYAMTATHISMTHIGHAGFSTLLLPSQFTTVHQTPGLC